MLSKWLTRIGGVIMSKNDRILVVGMAVVCMLVGAIITVVVQSTYSAHTPGTHPTPQLSKQPPLYSNGSTQYSTSVEGKGNSIQCCTVVVVVPKCTVVVEGWLNNKSPLSKVVEKNIKREVILERGGRTDVFDLEVFE